MYKHTHARTCTCNFTNILKEIKNLTQSNVYDIHYYLTCSITNFQWYVSKYFRNMFRVISALKDFNNWAKRFGHVTESKLAEFDYIYLGFIFNWCCCAAHTTNGCHRPRKMQHCLHSQYHPLTIEGIK